MRSPCLTTTDGPSCADGHSDVKAVGKLHTESVHLAPAPDGFRVWLSYPGDQQDGGIDPATIATRDDLAAALTALRTAAGLSVREVVSRPGNRTAPSAVGRGQVRAIARKP